MVRKGRVVLGILFFIGAAFMWMEVENINPSTKKTVDFCNAGWGDIFGAWGAKQCLQIQLFYYSPWILGIIGIVCFVKSRSEDRRYYY